MRLRLWARKGWRRLRLSRAARKRSGDRLREFVYLDEVSVFSLISSRIGGVATEFTDTQSSALRTELSTTAAGGPSVLKAEVSSAAETTRSSETQVLRKATVQGTFRELYSHIKDDLVLRPAEDGPPPAGCRDVRRAVAEAVAAGAATPVDELRRGRLIEVEVELEAEAVFHIITLVETLVQMAHDLPDEVVPDLRGQLSDVVALNALLGKLLVGLVPLRAKAVHHAILTSPEGSWVVDRRTFAGPPPDMTLQGLEIVAMAEVPLFWRDLRRVLFSGGRYTMLCRLGRDGLQASWNPVKLADLLRSFLPGIEEQLGEAQRQMTAAIQGTPAEPTAPAADDARLREALSAFADALAAHHQVRWRFEHAELALAAATGQGLEGQRPAFDFVAAAFRRDNGVDTDPVTRAELRQQATLTVATAGRDGPARPVTQPPAPAAEALILETEVVAIYW